MLPRLLPRLIAGSLVLSPVLVAQSRAPHPRPYLITNVRLGAGEDAPLRQLVLRDGRIASILAADASPPAGLWTIDGSDLIALPAFVDAYSHAGCDTPQPVAQQDRPVDPRGSVFTDMRAANRKGIQPTFHAAQVFELDDEASAAVRGQGFGLLLSAPEGELLAGRSALVHAHDGARRDRIVRGEVFDHAAFRASGDGYPSTLMGYHAQLRQLFLDAQRHGVLKQRFERGVPGSRPVYDEELDAALAILAGQRRLVCEAESAADIRRWIRLADELGLKIAISGGREAYKVADVLAARGIPVILTLDWGEEVEDPDAPKKKSERKEGEAQEEGDEPASDTEEEEPHAAPSDAQEPEEPQQPQQPQEPEEPEEGDEEEGQERPEAEDPEGDEPAAEDEGDGREWIYEEPLGVRRERRRRWEETRDGALVLAEAGVRFAFGTGDRKHTDLLKAIRTLVERGLSREVALDALTRGAGDLLGVGGAYGRLEPSYAASLALWTADPFEEDAHVRWLVVEGYPHELEVQERGERDRSGDDTPPQAGFDLSGRWELSAEGGPVDEPSVLELTMDEEGQVSGTVALRTPAGEALEEDVTGKVSGRSVRLMTTLAVGELTLTWKVEGSFSAPDAFNGTTTVSGPGFEDTYDCAALRLPQRRGQAYAETWLPSGALEAGAPTLPFHARRSLQPICGCNRHHGHHDHDDHDGDDQR